MKLLIFSGTTEGRELSVKLAAAGAEVTVCVATEYGSEEQGSCPGVTTLVGPLSPEENSACSVMPSSAWTRPIPMPPISVPRSALPVKRPESPMSVSGAPASRRTGLSS